jgi:tRNA pseudouridine-54 N-methylase
LRGRPPSYVHVSDGTLGEVVRHLIQDEDAKLWVLDESGASLSDCQSCFHTTQNSFMLGDHRGFDSQTVSLMSQYNIQKISLGKKSYLSSHCLAVIISEFERMVR